MPKVTKLATKPSTNGADPDLPARILPVQVTLTVAFAAVDDAGIDTLGQPVQFTLSGKVWEADWATTRSREFFDNIIGQLITAQDAASGPVQS